MYTINILRPTIVYTTKYHNYHKGVKSTFNGFSQTGNSVTLHYSVPLTEADQAAIQLADVSFVDNDPHEYIKNNILVPARSFGQSLIDEFAAENILLGITASGLTNQVRKALGETTMCLLTGSLYDAIYEAKAIPQGSWDGTYISEARIISFVNRIETYLGVPLTTDLP